MSIGKICECEVITVSQNMTIIEAAKLMKEYNIGDIVVTSDKNNNPLGILTDRDIVTEIIADEIDPNTILVSDTMSQDLLVLKSHQGVQEALDMMCAKGVRRAPVVNDKNEIIGIATVDDLLILIADELSSLGRLVRKQIHS